jgi:archaemetzincin
MQIIVQPILCSSRFGYSDNIYSLMQHLSKIFGGIIDINGTSLLTPFQLSSAETKATMPTTYLYDRSRKQWISKRVLDWLLGHNNPDSNTKVLALCDFDAYSDELNFVFGEAHFGGKVAAVYLPRLKQDFYLKKSDTNERFEQRIIKEAVHELGHTFGLTHCERSKCVMHFSKSLQDTDFKNERFCERCNRILKNLYSYSSL